MRKPLICFFIIFLAFLIGVSWGQTDELGENNVFFDAALSFRSLKGPTHYMKKGVVFVSPTLNDLAAARFCLKKSTEEGARCLDKISDKGGLMIYDFNGENDPIFVRVLETYNGYALIRDMDGYLIWTFESLIVKIPHPADKFFKQEDHQ